MSVVNSAELTTAELLKGLPVLQDAVKSGCQGRGKNEARETLNRSTQTSLRKNNEWVAERTRTLGAQLSDVAGDLDRSWMKEQDRKIQEKKDGISAQNSVLVQLQQARNAKNPDRRQMRIAETKAKLSALEEELATLEAEKAQRPPGGDPVVVKEMTGKMQAELRDLAKLSQQYQVLNRDAGFCLWDSQGRPGISLDEANQQAEEERKRREKAPPESNAEMPSVFSPIAPLSPIQVLPQPNATGTPSPAFP